MKRALLAAVLGIAALLPASLEPAPPIAVAPQHGTGAAATSPPPRPLPHAGGTERAMWRSPAQDRSPVPMADRVTRKAVRKALQAGPIQARLARCIDRDV